MHEIQCHPMTLEEWLSEYVQMCGVGRARNGPRQKQASCSFNKNIKIFHVQGAPPPPPTALFVCVFFTCRFVTQPEGAVFIFHRPVVASQTSSRIYRSIFVYMDSLSALQICGTVCCKASSLHVRILLMEGLLCSHRKHELQQT